ncbi:MAG TPA: response regulator transcription factor [Mycobacteriales bacterium]|jgi:CheY-like chemotaxis protein|nr:response regulator transcription factor [Mycobacteriales bacterium]
MAAVVVADDDEAVRLLLRFNLELEGHQVVGEAADGTMAVAVTCESKPDVLVLDMMMPGGGGADVLRRLSEYTRPQRPRVIAYSASLSHLEIAGELGADATILKSGDLADLMAAITAA